MYMRIYINYLQNSLESINLNILGDTALQVWLAVLAFNGMSLSYIYRYKTYNELLTPVNTSSILQCVK